MSLEEEQARQRAAQTSSAGSSSLPPVPEVVPPSQSPSHNPERSGPSKGPDRGSLGEAATDEEDEEAMLAKALALSQQGDTSEASPADVETASGGIERQAVQQAEESEEGLSEEEAIAKAIQMSLNQKK